MPSRRAVQDTTARIRSVLPVGRQITVSSLLRPADFGESSRNAGRIIVTSPKALLQLCSEDSLNLVRKLSLVVLEDLHLLDDLYELAVARILSIAKPARIRLFGITSSLHDPSDLATWLGVDEQSRFAFYPPNRGTPITLSLKAFTIPHSSTLIKAMIKPAYDILKTSVGGTILFAPSRAACRNIAADLVTQSGTEMDLNGFLGASRADVEPLLQRLRDQALLEPLLHGIGYIIPGMAPHDLALVLELFASNIIRGLIAPREACWTLPVRAETVILMGTQYVHMPDLPGGLQDHRGADRQIVNYSRQELVQMQGYAVTSAAPQAENGRMIVMCQAEQQVTISRILNDGLPLESSLPALLANKASRQSTEAFQRLLKPRPPPPRPQNNHPVVVDHRKRDIMDLVGWTYLDLRARSNPTYYELHPGHEAEELSRLVDQWFVGNGEYADPAYEGESKKRFEGKMAEKDGAKNGDEGEVKVGGARR
jgi:antiviral helicase SLH1